MVEITKPIMQKSASRNYFTRWNNHQGYVLYGYHPDDVARGSIYYLCRRGIGLWLWEYKKPIISQCSSYTAADDCWAARTNDHRTMVLPPRCWCWYDQRDFISYCKNTWRILFCEKKANSLAPQWHDKFLPEPYIDIFENHTHMLLVLTLSIVKLFVTLVRFILCF